MTDEQNLDLQTKKYLNFQWGYERIKKARDAGFPVEAIAILESVISQRAISLLVADNKIVIGTKNILDKHISYGKLIDHLSETSFADEDLREITRELKEWGESRNDAVHSAVKYKGGEPNINEVEFVEKATISLKHGEKLDQKLNNWIKKWKRNKDKK